MIRDTYGLPYAHQIAKLTREGHPIPVSVVHPYWMKLDLMKSKVNEVSFDLNLKAE